VGREIERKFLVRDPSVVEHVSGTPIRQGYLSTDPDRTVRVRRAGERAYITIKGRARGPSRAEYEYEVPAEDAAELLDALCLRPILEKTRYRILHAGRTWEVDVFGSDNAGLVTAEIELPDEDVEVDIPDWVGPEVTGDGRFVNANLVARPWTAWPADERDATGQPGA
jgi:adenylate cyclase